MVKAIIFDFFGTLVENGIHSPVKQAKWILGLRDMPFPDFIIKFEKAFMLQKFESLSKAFENVCKEFSIEPDEFTIDQLIGMWNKNKLLAKPFGDTINTLGDLKKDYKIILLSNTDAFSINDVLEKYSLKPIFDDIVFSYEIGLLKTDPEIFKKILKKHKLKKDDVVMVGDSLESDIKGAEQAGIEPVLLDRRDRMEYKNKITNLYQLRDFLKNK